MIIRFQLHAEVDLAELLIASDFLFDHGFDIASTVLLAHATPNTSSLFAEEMYLDDGGMEFRTLDMLRLGDYLIKKYPSFYEQYKPCKQAGELIPVIEESVLIARESLGSKIGAVPSTSAFYRFLDDIAKACEKYPDAQVYVSNWYS